MGVFAMVRGWRRCVIWCEVFGRSFISFFGWKFRSIGRIARSEFRRLYRVRCEGLRESTPSSKENRPGGAEYYIVYYSRLLLTYFNFSRGEISINIMLLRNVFFS